MSPQNQEILNNLISSNKNSKNTSSQQNSIPSPKPQGKSHSEVASSPNKDSQQIQPADDSISVELDQNEIAAPSISAEKERINTSTNGPCSGSSTSSSSSSISNNNQTKSPKLSVSSQQQQQAISHHNGGLYYAQFNPSFSEGQNIYTLRTIGGPAALHHPNPQQPNQQTILQQHAHLTQHHLGIPLSHQYVPFQQPPPPHAHNPNIQQQQYYNSMHQQVIINF